MSKELTFKTASGKQLYVKNDTLERVAKLFEEDIQKDDMMIEDTPDLLNKKFNSLSLSPLHNSVVNHGQFNNFKEKFDIEFENDTFEQESQTFDVPQIKTASGKVLQIKKETLQKIKNLLED